jgi:antitoxin component YwqK of YwqJK toxin-antitoxin module
MRKNYNLFIILLLFVVAGFHLSAQNEINPNGYNTFYYENGNKSSEGTMVDGKPDGYWKTYHENGILKSEGNRLNFLLDSTWKFFDEEGDLLMVINYREGKKDGPRITFRRDEIVEENFKGDIKQGLTTYYYPDSTVMKTINFVDGREDGLAKEFGEDGRVVTLTTYKKGYVVSRERINRKDASGRKQGLWKFFHENGLVQLEGKYANDLKDGFFKEYDESGKLLATSKWVEGELQENAAELVRLDIVRDYYPDGSVMTMQTFRNGVAQGVRRDYDENGNIVSGAFYKDGEKVGEGITLEDGVRDGVWKEFYNNGVLRGEGVYEKGVKVGVWKYYHPNGQLEQTGEFDKKGRLKGTWVWYYPSGKVLREENYRSGLLDGLMTEYDEAGNIIAEGEYIEGLEEGPWVYQYGDFREEGSYSYGYRNGYWKSFDSSGELLFEGEFIDNNPNGKHLFYWDNGKVKDEINYLMGMKDGDWRKFNYDGSLFLVISFDNGIEKKYDGVTIKPAFEEPFDQPFEDFEE